MEKNLNFNKIRGALQGIPAARTAVKSLTIRYGGHELILLDVQHQDSAWRRCVAVHLGAARSNISRLSWPHCLMAAPHTGAM